MDIPDELLVEQWKAGDEGAFERLFRRYEVPLFAYFYRLVGDRATAEDLFQETFSHFIAGIERFDATRRLSSWLYTIATNRWKDHLKKAGRHGRVEVGMGVMESGVRPSYDRAALLEELVRREMEGEVREAVMALPEEHRLVLVMRHYQGLSYQEIAGIVNCPLGTVKSRMHYAVTALRERFVKKGLLELA
jgi:RNA polymerase sigma-70 factor (ECF subfamily)